MYLTLKIISFIKLFHSIHFHILPDETPSTTQGRVIPFRESRTQFDRLHTFVTGFLNSHLRLTTVSQYHSVRQLFWPVREEHHENIFTVPSSLFHFQ